MTVDVIKVHLGLRLKRVLSSAERVSIRMIADVAKVHFGLRLKCLLCNDERRYG